MPNQSTSKQPLTTVALFLERMINSSDKSQTQIAKETGYENPNMITMIKQGRTKLAVKKVAPFAKSLGVDPIYLFKMVMQEYEPETWVAIQESILKNPVVTNNEMKIIEIIREANVINPRIRTENERARLLEVIETLRPDGDLD